MKLFISIILSCFLFSSCGTLNKALNKVASADKLDASQNKLLATVCSVRYPPQEYTSPGTTIIDSAAYKQEISSMQEKLDLYQRDYANLAKMLKEGGNADVAKVLEEVKRRSDSLSIALSIAKAGKIPCPTQIKTDTAHLVNKAELTACQENNNQLSIESAKKDVQIAALTEQNKILSEKPDRYWKGFRLGAIIAASVLVVLGIFLKLKSII